MRAAREALRESGSAEIVNTASIGGVWGSGSSIPYSASKASLITGSNKVTGQTLLSHAGSNIGPRASMAGR